MLLQYKYNITLLVFGLDLEPQGAKHDNDKLIQSIFVQYTPRIWAWPTSHLNCEYFSILVFSKLLYNLISVD